MTVFGLKSDNMASTFMDIGSVLGKATREMDEQFDS